MLIPDMDFDIMWLNDVTGHITIKDEKLIRAEQYECSNFIRFLPKCEITMPLLIRLLEDRCWERSRADLNDILKALDIESYNPFLIVLKTHGSDFDDKLWFRFKGEENLTWEKDIDPRREV